MFVCLFDIDGTLLSSGGAGKAAMYAAIASEFGISEINDGVPFAGRTDRAICRDLLLHHSLEDSPANWQRLRASYLRHLPAFLASRPGCVLPGVAALLEQLQTRGDVAIGLLTGNIRDGARTKLGHYSIEHYFAFGGFGDNHFDRNDVAQEALDEVRSHVGPSVGPDRIWVIGDTPLDVRCARSIGARVLAVATGFHSVEELRATSPDVLVSDLSPGAQLVADMFCEDR